AWVVRSGVARCAPGGFVAFDGYPVRLVLGAGASSFGHHGGLSGQWFGGGVGPPWRRRRA
ncbi:hypothetical protein, partial [Mycobacterium attenuatum]|uniref:hypothetical protein n=1 Tax=Mycobacterium attenuatum TaxID=2341086 RepID=UPI001B7D4E80